MSTIEITRIEDVQVGDLVTLEDRRDPSDDGIFKPDPKWRLIGHVRAIDVTTTDNDGRPYGWGVQIGHTPYPVGYLSPGGVMWAYSLVSATREVPEWEPGTAGTATVAVDAEVMTSGWLPGTHLFRVDAGWRDVDDRFYTDGQVRDFVPDDAEALRRSLEAAREGYRKEAADWRARDTRMGAEVERLEAEVERLRDSMDANTNVLISSNGTIWHHDTQCPHRRTMPTRKQLVDAMWPDAPEGARVQMMSIDMVDRVLALIEQGDES